MNPAAHSAREDAERSGQVVGSDVDVVEDALLSERLDEARHLTDLHAALEGSESGAWLYGEGPAA